VPTGVLLVDVLVLVEVLVDGLLVEVDVDVDVEVELLVDVLAELASLQATKPRANNGINMFLIFIFFILSIVLLTIIGFLIKNSILQVIIYSDCFLMLNQKSIFFLI